MSAPRRILPESPRRRGWCPSLAHPMPTGDGLLARIHPPLGILGRAQVRAVAEAARTFGNGHVDVTARANLQLRGVTEFTRSGLVAALEAAGLGDARDDGGPQRLTLTSPLAGIVEAAVDLAGIARAIEARGLAIPGLPPKTLVLVANGTELSEIEADLHVRATEPGIAGIGLAEADRVTWIAACREADIPGFVAMVLGAFAATGRRRIRDLSSVERTSLTHAALHASTGAASSLPPLRERMLREAGEEGKERSPLATRALRPATILELEAPFGRCTAAMLDRLAAVADDLGVDDARVSPTRGFVLPMRGARSHRRGDALAELADAGFITAPDDPRRGIAACPGAPACASGSTSTGADAFRLAEAFRPFAARGMTAHVSGCAKGCAHPGRADLTLIGRDGRYGVVLDGAPGDAPALELTFDAALERVRRADSGMLAQAFAPSPSGRPPRAEPLIGTTI